MFSIDLKILNLDLDSSLLPSTGTTAVTRSLIGMKNYKHLKKLALYMKFSKGHGTCPYFLV